MSQTRCFHPMSDVIFTRGTSGQERRVSLKLIFIKKVCYITPTILIDRVHKDGVWKTKTTPRYTIRTSGQEKEVSLGKTPQGAHQSHSFVKTIIKIINMWSAATKTTGCTIGTSKKGELQYLCIKFLRNRLCAPQSKKCPDTLHI